jgi:SPP1 family predicted phage head-tail adaptor
MANANDLNRRVAIWKFNRTVNAAGTPKEEWVFLKYTYANLKVLNGNTVNADPPGDLPETFVDIIVRYDPEINYQCQIRYNGQVYRINFIQDDWRKNFYTLKCVTHNEYLET